ncbi:hypothetical protein GCM10011491_43700 [Brucella endophytica]|uniref:Uncharacterized protein n=1 Tax=Brucella endophytica TaxID=1963359 RepID=A0A916SS75_9HYPH|nr:hypothetical protein GCM10011491_43700 [Brucella endophytica]
MGRIIEPALFLLRVPLASGRRQGKLRRRPVQICTLSAAPLPPLLFAGRRKRSRKLREKEPGKKGGRESAGKRM